MPALSIISELRRSPRRTVPQWESPRAGVSALGPDGRFRVQQGCLLDLSEGGLALRSFSPLAEGTIGTLRFGLGGEADALTARGRLVWRGASGRAGFEFILLSTSARQGIRHWVQRGVSITDRDRGSSAPCFPDHTLSNFEVALHSLVRRARLVAGASGAAIALGDSSRMECRASAGRAPAVGAMLGPESGLSGECLRTGQWVQCRDISSDSRVDFEVAQALQIRSLAVAPIMVGLGPDGRGEIAGLLEVLWREPHVLHGRHLDRVKALVEAVAALVGQQGKEKREPASYRTETASRQQLSRAEHPGAAFETRDLPAVVTSAAGPVRPRFLLALRGGIVALLAACALGTIWYLTHQESKPAGHPISPAAEVGRAPAPPTSETSATGPRPTISFVPSDVMRQAGSTFSIDLMLNGAHDLSSILLPIT